LIGVDTGGTFTDIFASTGVIVKVASTPDDPVRAIMSGLHKIPLKPGDSVAHGTTVATNAVLERKGARTALVTTAGFEDVLEIRRQNRPAIYDLLARWPDPLVPRERRFGAVERLDYEGSVLQYVDERQVAELAGKIRELGTESVAVCLLFSYANPVHELAVRRIFEGQGLDAQSLSLSHEIAPQYGEYERTSTTVVNAYVTTVVRRYLLELGRALRTSGVPQLHIMNSNGGLVSAATVGRRPVQTILSGPAAGVMGARAIARAADQKEIITFDMGGTSTDVAVVPGAVLERDDGEVGSFPLLIPMLTIETVGAGGGSIARVDAGGGLHVGPDSAGAAPGPAAYGLGDQPTVTDANLVLARLSSRGLLGGDMPLDASRARESLRSIAGPLGISTEQAAWAVIRLANSNMERAVRAVTLQKGYDPRKFTMVAFGGAGPMHAAELVHALGMRRVLVPPHPGLVAALGLTVPDLRRDLGRTVLLPLEEAYGSYLRQSFQDLEFRARETLTQEELSGFAEASIHRVVDLRYIGQSFELRLPYQASTRRLREAFDRAHKNRYGYSSRGQAVEVVHLWVRATAPRLEQPRLIPDWPQGSEQTAERDVCFGSSVGIADFRRLRSTILWRPSLAPGALIKGPAVVEQYDSATLVPPGWTANVDQRFNLVLTAT
jgi:N-methylhydantoinase A